MIARPRGLGEGTLVVLTAAALTVALTYPLAFQIDRIGRVNTDDGRWSVWVVSWVAHALTTNPFRVFDANIFYPHTSTLAYSEANIAAGAIGIPFWLLSHNPHLTHNAVVLLGFIIAFTGTYYLLRYLTASRPAALVSAVLFAFCPYIFARTAHIQLLLTGGLPFCLLAFHRLVDRQTVSRSVTLGLLIWAQSLACAYYGVFAILGIGLGTVLFAVTRGLWRSVDYWVAIALAAFVSIALTLPFFWPYLQVQQETGFTRTLDDARQYSVELGSWFASAAWAHRWWLSALGNVKDVLFPGGITLLAGIAGAVLQFLPKRIQPTFPQVLQRDVAILYLLIAVVAFWSSFGPDAGLYWVLYKTVPFFTFMRAPGRMGIMVTLSLIVLAAPLFAWLVTRVRRPMLAGVVLAMVAAAELTSAPLTQYRAVEPVSQVYRMLATQPYGPVLEMPYWYERSDFPRHAYYMLRSTTHWMPLINGYSDHIPQDFRNTVIPLSSFPTRESFGLLAKANVRYVVFHMDLYSGRSRERLMERLKTYERYLRLLGRDDYVWLYEIVDWPN